MNRLNITENSIVNKNVVGAIILGGHIQAYGIIRQMGEMGFNSVVIDNEPLNISKYSKYCKASYVETYNKTKDLLFKLAQDRNYYNWLIIPTDDYYLRIISENYDELSKYFILLTEKWEKVSIFFNKCKTYPWIDKLGIPIPYTLYPESIDEIESIKSYIGYPCIIKPSIMKDFYNIFGSKVLVCDNYDDLIYKYKKALRHFKFQDLMLQQIIPGSSENQYSIGLFSVKGEIYNYIMVRRKRQHPPDFGNATTYAETVNIPVLLDYANRIIDEIKYTGVCEIEFKYDCKSNEYKFLEVNPRFWKWHIITQKAEVPFIRSIISYYYIGQPIISQNYINAAWEDIATDLPTIFNYISKGLYKKPLGYKKINAVANKKDPKPFLMQLLLLPYLYKTRR